MIFRSKGEISCRPVFIRHCWSRVRKAWITSPLSSVTIVEYSILSGSGKTPFINRKSRKAAADAIPRRFRSLNQFLFLRLAASFFISPQFPPLFVTDQYRTCNEFLTFLYINATLRKKTSTDPLCLPVLASSPPRYWPQYFSLPVTVASSA